MAPSPKWMKYTLFAAGLYNLAWGLFVVLAPTFSFENSGLQKDGVPNVYPQLWQCIGMIVGVYGIGYILASSAPVRHWPIIAVGMLGKIFGPLGYVLGVIKGETPPGLLRTILFNDLIWWLPFGLILAHAYRSIITEAGAAPALPLGEALASAHASTGDSLAELTARRPALVVFLRHFGCTYCREALADLAKAKPKLDAAGVGLVLIHPATAAESARELAGTPLSDVPSLADPSGALYRAFGLGRGTPGQLFGPKAVARFWEAGVKGGHGVGVMVGDGLRMPGVFLVENGTILREFRHSSVADRPDYCEIAAAPQAAGVSA